MGLDPAEPYDSDDEQPAEETEWPEPAEEPDEEPSHSEARRERRER